MRISSAIAGVLGALRRSYDVDLSPKGIARPYATPAEGIGALTFAFHELLPLARDDGGWGNMQLAAALRRVSAIALRMIVDLEREGCVECSDHECDRHPKQDMGGDFEITSKDWPAARGLPVWTWVGPLHKAPLESLARELLRRAKAMRLEAQATEESQPGMGRSFALEEAHRAGTLEEAARQILVEHHREIPIMDEIAIDPEGQ